MSCDHDRTTSLVSSQQPWLVAEDLHKSKPVSILAWSKKGAHGELRLLEERVNFLEG